MSTAAQRSQRARRGLIAGSLVWIGMLLVVPLAGIVVTALKPGLGIIADTLSQPDVQHALFLTAWITLITVVVTTVAGF